MKTLAEAPALADFFLLGDDEYLFDEKAAAKWLTHPGVTSPSAPRPRRLRGSGRVRRGHHRRSRPRHHRRVRCQRRRDDPPCPRRPVRPHHRAGPVRANRRAGPRPLFGAIGPGHRIGDGVGTCRFRKGIERRQCKNLIAIISTLLLMYLIKRSPVYVQARLEVLYGNEWFEKLPKNIRYEGESIHWDTPAILNTLLSNWHDAFHTELDYDGKNLVGELKGYRNKIAHRSAENLLPLTTLIVR